MRLSVALGGAVLAAVAVTSPAAGAAPAEPQVLGTDAAACQAGGGPAIQATVTGLKDRRGQVRLELYPATAEDYLAPDKQLVAQGKVFRRVAVEPPAAGPLVMCIRVPHAGRYALVMLHNRDGRMKFDYKVDGAGTASNRRIGFGKPSLVSATVEAGAGITVIAIHAQYLGLFGFALSSAK